MATRYVICPGWINSKSDGDAHYIGVLQLVHLYNVPPGTWIEYSRLNGSGVKREECVWLAPCYHGNYYDVTKVQV